MEVKIIALITLLFALEMFRVYRDKILSNVEKIIELTTSVIAFTVFLVYIWLAYISGELSASGRPLDGVLLTRYVLIMCWVLTINIVFTLCRQIMMLRLKKPTFFPLTKLVTWSLVCIAAVVVSFNRDTYLPEDEYIPLMFFAALLVVGGLCSWIDNVNRKEYLRRVAGTESPPSPPGDIKSK